MEAHLTVEEGPEFGQVFVVQPGQMCTIGKRGEQGVLFGLRDPSLPAGTIAAFKLDDSGLRIVDLGGPLGATLNDKRLPPRAPVVVQAGDGIGIGKFVLRASLFGQQASGARAATPPVGLRKAPPTPGSELPAGEFEVLKILGQGGMGKVYAAIRKADRKKVAIKVLHDNVATGSDESRRFVREAQIGTSIDSPFVVKVFDLKVANNRAMIVMELVEGPALDDRFPGKSWHVADALRVSEDAARGLAAAAAKGIIHRDVKPGNILLSPEGRAKLTDFGIARKTANESMASLTATGQGLGTMVYMPPEQISEAKAVDPRADIYSLGVTMFELIAGIPPFKIETVEELVRASYEDAAPLTSMRSDCPPQVATIVQHMLKKEPHERPATPQLVADTLKRVREQLYPQHRFDHLFPRAVMI